MGETLESIEQIRNERRTKRLIMARTITKVSGELRAQTMKINESFRTDAFESGRAKNIYQQTFVAAQIQVELLTMIALQQTHILDALATLD